MLNQHARRIFIVVIIVAFLLSVLTFSFSYFYMQAKGSKGVKTESAKLGLSLDVKRITSEKTIGLFPLEDSQLQSALTGTSYGSCIDSLNKGRCQVYEVKLTNTGNVVSTIFGTLDLKPNDKSKFTNLKWMEIRSAKDATPFGSMHLYTDKDWKNNFVMGVNASSTFYLMVWISETGKNQDNEDNGTFTGTITFNSTAGVGTSAAFTG